MYSALQNILSPQSRKLGVVCLFMLSTTVHAQWSTVLAVDADTGDSVKHTKAQVIGDRGGQLQIFLSADKQLIAEFTLGKGLLSLDSNTCPTLQVDKTAPENFNEPRHQCEINGALARFILSTDKQGKLVSKTFLELMNGSRLRIRYRLQGTGYGQQEFSLKGSKQSLQATLTKGVEVVKD